MPNQCIYVQTWSTKCKAIAGPFKWNYVWVCGGKILKQEIKELNLENSALSIDLVSHLAQGEKIIFKVTWQLKHFIRDYRVKINWYKLALSKTINSSQ